MEFINLYKIDDEDHIHNSICFSNLRNTEFTKLTIYIPQKELSKSGYCNIVPEDKLLKWYLKKLNKIGYSFILEGDEIINKPIKGNLCWKIIMDTTKFTIDHGNSFEVILLALSELRFLYEGYRDDPKYENRNLKAVENYKKLNNLFPKVDSYKKLMVATNSCKSLIDYLVHSPNHMNNNRCIYKTVGINTKVNYLKTREYAINDSSMIGGKLKDLPNAPTVLDQLINDENKEKILELYNNFED